MTEICPKCGLPKELCVCDVLDKETETKIKIYRKKAKYNKVMTVVEGIAPNSLADTTKELKRLLACGGTYKDNHIELQGDHREATKKLLVNLGYKDTGIDVE